MYRIILGEEDMPNKLKQNNYSNKVLSFSIKEVNKDKNR
jgi:hypothetical protein